MKREFSSFGASDQPEDCGEMTQREIDDERREILESDEFGSDLIDFISDGVTPEQASKLGKLVDDGHTDKAGQYIFHLLYSEIDKIIRRIQEAK